MVAVKNKYFVILIVILFIGAGRYIWYTNYFNPGSAIHLSEPDNQKTDTILQGQIVKITLNNVGDAGADFDVPEYDSTILNLNNHSHRNPPQFTNRIGDSGTDTWEFTAIKAGATYIRISATQVWKGGSSMNVFMSTIVVK